MEAEAVTWADLDAANVIVGHYSRKPAYLVEAIADQNAAWEMHLSACDHLEGLSPQCSLTDYQAAFQAVGYAENTCQIAARRLAEARQRFNLEAFSS